jgi:hypothetical protein
MMTKELEWVLKKYPRGYHSVTKKEMDRILDAYEYQMESPGGISGKLGVSRETLRVWAKKKIIHYFVCRDKLFRILTAYIPLSTLVDAPFPNPENFQKAIDDTRRYLESVDKRRREYYEEQIRLEKKEAEKKGDA